MSFDDLKNNIVELSESDLEQVAGAGGLGGYNLGGLCGGCGISGIGGGIGYGPYIMAEQNYCSVNFALTYSTVQKNSFVEILY